jgi:hypothetical protein
MRSENGGEFESIASCSVSKLLPQNEEWVSHRWGTDGHRLKTPLFRICVHLCPICG